MQLSLDWKRPADGVEVVSASEAFPGYDVRGDAIRGKTERLMPVPIRARDLSDPVSIRLINAHSEKTMADFVARFGVLEVLGYNHDQRGELVSALSDMRDDLTAGMELLDVVDDAAWIAWAQEHLHTASCFPSLEWNESDRRQRLVFKPGSLAALMKCEVAMAMEAGAAMQRCERCGSAFLTGPTTGRRSSSAYCSNRCRVAALRARNAGKGTS